MPSSRHNPGRGPNGRAAQQLALPFSPPSARFARPNESEPPPTRTPATPGADAARVATELSSLPTDDHLPDSSLDHALPSSRDHVRRELELDDDFGPTHALDAEDDDEVDRPRLDPARVKAEAQRLGTELGLLMGHGVRLVVHDNRSTMVSFRRSDQIFQLRIHHMFLDAGPEVVRALAEYGKARSVSAGRVLDRYVKEHREAIRPVDEVRERERTLRTDGEVYDLRAIYDRLNAKHFGGRIDARIGWGRGSHEKRRRTIRMGAYYHQTKTILIHPALDRTEVPAYFVDLVVFHEMLHQAEPARELGDGRRCVHTPEFRARERAFEDYERARAWERRHLHVLLRPPKARPRG